MMMAKGWDGTSEAQQKPHLPFTSTTLSRSIEVDGIYALEVDEQANGCMERRLPSILPPVGFTLRLCTHG